ncbi:MAG: Mrp/NBP35 family ATP-binding protein [Actinobacteria bacterium]|nr:Mrp/NBP35 family ATP-binding protein [Actinomycetota bacterium]
MVTEEQVHAALRAVAEPTIGTSIEDLGMVRGVEVEGGDVRVYVVLPVADVPTRDRLAAEIGEAVRPLEGVRRVDVAFGEMTGEDRGLLTARLRGPGAAASPNPTYFTDGTTTVVAVASGKGGVGKSSVTVNLACSLAADGYRVGVVDVDVWGFSVPRMMGLSGQPRALDDMILPMQAHGVKVVSMGFFVTEETPVIWRGPMLHKAVQQFLGDVYWGDLDFLLCDLPPGTGDVSISLASFMPGAKMLVVTTPQEAARKVAERAGKMAAQTRMEAVGVIENMSSYVCPHCGAEEPIFGEGGGRLAAETLGVPLLAQVPLVPALREGGDEGKPIVVSDPDGPAGEALRHGARELAAATRRMVGRSLGLEEAR